VIGCVFGTIGVFAIALVSLLSADLEFLLQPFLLPGRFFAGLLASNSASNSVIILLYLLTGLFYGIVGALIQDIHRHIRLARMHSFV
jgi:hypothetical protein